MSSNLARSSPSTAGSSCSQCKIKKDKSFISKKNLLSNKKFNLLKKSRAGGEKSALNNFTNSWKEN